MKVLIEIQCQDKTDLMAHLSAARQQLQGAFKESFPVDPENVTIQDGNQYGEHTIKINPKHD
jgi:hypothetical protein